MSTTPLAFTLDVLDWRPWVETVDEVAELALEPARSNGARRTRTQVPAVA